MVQTLPCGSLFWNINIAWLSMHNSICPWTVQSNISVFAVRLRTQKARSLREKSWSKPFLSILLLTLLRSILWVPGDFIVTTLLENRKVLPSLQKLLPRSGELQQNKKMAELLSAALIPCSPLRLSFLLSVPWAELHFYRNKFVAISQTQVKCSKSRSQAQFSIAACLWQLKWWLYLLMTV